MPHRRVAPVTPEHINDVLADEDTYQVDASEAVEREFAEMIRAIAREAGEEAFTAAIIPMFLVHEERWRREIPNHPGLRVIDRWREGGGKRKPD